VNLIGSRKNNARVPPTATLKNYLDKLMSVPFAIRPIPGSAFRFFWAAFAMMAILGLTGCQTLFPLPGAPPEGVAAVVQMTNLLDFNPRKITVRVGDTVEWQNPSLFTHTVTLDAALARTVENVTLPAEVQPSHSADVPPNSTYRHTFTVAGTYRYVCLPHERLGMVGVVIVLPAE
jgi:plastocyanin